MHDLIHRHVARTLSCTALILSLTGCEDWLTEVLTRAGHEPSSPPASTAHEDPAKAVLPSAPAHCPKLESGVVQFKGHDVQLWVGAQNDDVARPVIVYWHGTGSSASEAATMLAPAFDDVLAQGGIIASLTDTTEEGDITSTGTWYTGDFVIVDELIGCLGAHAHIDAQRIYTAGCDSGGIQAAALAYARSRYIAAAMLSSGGQVVPFALQDPRRAPAVITAHGEPGLDVVIVDFAAISEALDQDLVSKGGFAVDCNHHGPHCGAPPELIAAQWEFLKAHPYGIAPEPYSAGLPDGFPAYCKIVE